MSKKSLVDLLNSYLAIEGILNSRVLSDETKQKAYEALKLLDEQFSEIIGEHENEGTTDPKDKAA